VAVEKSFPPLMPNQILDQFLPPLQHPQSAAADAIRTARNTRILRQANPTFRARGRAGKSGFEPGFNPRSPFAFPAFF
jgi:hypothetical protein